MELDFWRGRRVFITGHTGFKGTWLSAILSYAGADVTGFALAPQETPNLYEIVKPTVRSIIGDIRDLDALMEAYKPASPEAVFHMAAQPLVLRGYREPLYTYAVNAMGTANLLECVHTIGARSVVNVTTDKVYYNSERARGYREDERLDGYDPYANSKSCSELITACYGRSYLGEAAAVSTARSGNVIGGGDFAENRLIPDCARASARGESVKIRNPGSVRPYQHVLDTLSAYLLIARRQYEEPMLAGSYNIGPNEKDCVTSAALAELFCQAWGPPARWEHVPVENPHESSLLTLDCEKIERALGWTPRWDIGRSVRETALWYKAYENGNANPIMNRQIETFFKQEEPF